jgi:hypothetical protein
MNYGKLEIYFESHLFTHYISLDGQNVTLNNLDKSRNKLRFITKNENTERKIVN